jgi:hypothetical protein
MVPVTGFYSLSPWPGEDHAIERARLTLGK